jgi:hypothetical protein
VSGCPRNNAIFLFINLKRLRQFVHVDRCIGQREAAATGMRRVKKACVSSSAIPSWWSTQPSRVTLMLKVCGDQAASGTSCVRCSCCVSGAIWSATAHGNNSRSGPGRQRS